VNKPTCVLQSNSSEPVSEAEVWLAGFSFGSLVMLRAAACDERVRALSPPESLFRNTIFRIAQCKAEVVRTGSQDQFDQFRFGKALAALDDRKN
jgi:alpha/beta superfamily hydrolase